MKPKPEWKHRMKDRFERSCEKYDNIAETVYYVKPGHMSGFHVADGGFFSFWRTEQTVAAWSEVTLQRRPHQNWLGALCNETPRWVWDQVRRSKQYISAVALTSMKAVTSWEQVRAGKLEMSCNKISDPWSRCSSRSTALQQNGFRGVSHWHLAAQYYYWD